MLISILHFLGFDGHACTFSHYFQSDWFQRVLAGDTELLYKIRCVTGKHTWSFIVYPLYFRFHLIISHCRYHLYGDAAQLYCSFRHSDLPKAIDSINADLNKLLNISSIHKVNIYLSKSSAVLFANAIHVNFFKK